MCNIRLLRFLLLVSILILLDYLFLFSYYFVFWEFSLRSFNPYFTGLPILIQMDPGMYPVYPEGFNPYFTGLPILISGGRYVNERYKKVSILILLDYLFLSGQRKILSMTQKKFQSLFYWITYSYYRVHLR